MRAFLIFTTLTNFILASGQASKSAKVRFDGFYQTVSEIDKEDNDTTWTYFRFYPDGKVIDVATEGTASDIKSWFNLNMDDPSIGNYEISGKQLYFSTTSKAGTVIYRGKIIDEYRLSFKTKSLINGYKGREKYYFIKIPDLK